MSPKLSHNKICNIEDFEDKELRNVIRTIFSHEIQRFGEGFPTGFQYRKYWEIAMTVRAMLDTNILRNDKKVLGIGAGNEPTIFWLTNLTGQVFATDLYLNMHDWSQSSNISMMVNPGIHWPGQWNPQRLVVQHMDALQLNYVDNSFDAIFSSSSIEHFGSVENVKLSLDEMYRVLKPGGFLNLSTEFHIEGAPPGITGIMMFNMEETREIFINNPRWELVTPFDFTMSEATIQTVLNFKDTLKDYLSHIRKHGQVIHHKLDWSKYPHIVLRDKKHLWTSMHLCMKKL